MKVAREAFIEKRKALVTELEILSRQLEGKNDAAIVSELRRMGKALEEYSLIGQDLDEDLCDCIPGKCCNLAAIMEEVADQIEFDQADVNQIEHDHTDFVHIDFEKGGIHRSLKTIYEVLAMHVGRLTLDNHLYIDGYALHFVQKVNDEDCKWALETQGRDEKLYALWMRMNRVQEPGPLCSFQCMIMEATGPHGLEN